ncbi:MAG: hypothetical protein WC624_04740, partial [Candidatus Margulisiibacteriota bacterium]
MSTTTAKASITSPLLKLYFSPKATDPQRTGVIGKLTQLPAVDRKVVIGELIALRADAAHADMARGLLKMIMMQSPATPDASAAEKPASVDLPTEIEGPLG